MTSVLLVDDDPQLLRALGINLRARRYDVLTATDGATALSIAASRRPDAVILDLGLPDLDGVDVVHGLRGWTQTPILVLSAREDQADKVAALDAGADDYITKPFGMDELLARLRAALRRVSGSADGAGSEVRLGAITVDLVSARVHGPGGDIRLTPTEWHLLAALVKHPARLMTHQQLLTEVWGPAYTQESHYLRVYIAQLRRKLEVDPAAPRHLVTEAGMGYRFEP